MSSNKAVLRSQTGKAKDKGGDDVSISQTAESLSSAAEPISPACESESLTATNQIAPVTVAAMVSLLMEDKLFLDKLATSISDSVSSIIGATLEASLRPLKDEIKQLKEELAELKSYCSNELDDIQQYQRRNNVIITGIPEVAGEDTDDKVLHLFNTQLKLNMSKACIDRSHRVGRRILGKSEKTRPIIVKFVSYRDRRTVLNEKRMLKGSGIVMREHLTTRRVAVFNEVSRVHGQKNVWTRDGKIFYRNAEDRVMTVVLREQASRGNQVPYHLTNTNQPAT